jgi:hypothetical protein
VLHGLPIGTPLDVYIKDSCIGLASSPWFGPVTFIDSGVTVATETIIAESNEVTIFPNPANNSVHFRSNPSLGNIDVLIYNIQGLLVNKTTSQASHFSIDLSSLATGTYVVQCRNDTYSGIYRLNVIH